MKPIDIARDLKSEASRLTFSAPVAWVYNPLDYAWRAHRQYLERYGSGRRKVLMIGMNPGPWGMVQTGVPFGDVPSVRDWMGIKTPIARPRDEHPKRPVLGFACQRREASGRRLWGWAETAYGTPRRFFKTFFVSNYCPLAFFDEDGKNRTPDKLPADERSALFAVCDTALTRLIDYLQPEIIIGIGRFAEQRAADAVGSRDIKVAAVTHPSPANPVANRGWTPQMERVLDRLGMSRDGTA